MAYGSGSLVRGTMNGVGTSSPDNADGAFVAGPGYGDGRFNLTISGTFVATFVVERLFPGGTNWHPCTNQFAAVAPTTTGSEVLIEPEPGTRYRIRITSYTSGQLVYRFSQG